MFPRHNLRTVLTLILSCACRWGEAQNLPGREVAPGISTIRPIPGKPYDLAGKRIVFTNWHYIHPGDLDWVDTAGKSVYVKGDSAPGEARHVGIEAPRGIRIIAQKPTVMGPIDGLPHRSIMQEGNLYKGWSNNEYFESADGLKWRQKANCTFEGPVGDGVWQVFADPAAPPAERYKMVWATDNFTRAEFDEFRKKRPDGWEPRALLHVAEEKATVSCVRGAVSPDGIHWMALPDPLVVEYSDTYNTCYYDQFLGKYVLYTRYWSVGPTAQSVKPDIRNSWTDVGRRAIGRSESDNFRNFAPSEMILEPTPEMLPSETLYTNCHTTIPGAPDHHLMFPAVWNASVPDSTRIKMASSWDGKNWHWVPGGDVLETGRFGEWDGGCIWALPGLIELPGGDWALPYMGHNLPHKYPRKHLQGKMGYAIWPKGRMVGLQADDEGQFSIIPFVTPGKRLKINGVTEPAGWIKVEVARVDGRGFEDCVALAGDLAWAVVKWKGTAEMGVEPGKAVMLRIKMHQATLFGLQFD